MSWLDPTTEIEMPKGQKAPEIPAAFAEAFPARESDPRAGALRRTFTANPSTNQAQPRTGALRRTEPGHDAVTADSSDKE